MRGAAIVVALLLAPPAGARGDEPAAACTLRVVHGFRTDGEIDGRLSDLAPRLREPPFRPWHSFHLFSREKQTLRPTARADYSLPDRRRATVGFIEHRLRADGRHVVRGTLDLDGKRSVTRTRFELDEGGVLLVAGHMYWGGVLIYALSCRTAD